MIGAGASWMTAAFAMIAASAHGGAPDRGVCIRNGSGQAHYFVAESPDGARRLARLAPGEALCAPAASTAGGQGMVSVFEELDSIEGCSRLADPGRAETLLEYEDFDRCLWGEGE